jgi:hypothetical protein
MTRKPIQISAASNSEGPPTLYALCNDGSVRELEWGPANHRWRPWERLPAIPQEKPLPASALRTAGGS